MGKLNCEFETKYNKNDIVLFKSRYDIGKQLHVGTIELYDVQFDMGIGIWYRIVDDEELVFTVFESDILFKLTNNQIDDYKQWIENND